MMKAGLQLAIVLVAFLLSTAACGAPMEPAGVNAEAAEPPKIRITLWHNWVGQDGKAIAMRGILDEFRAARPEIELIDEGFPTDNLKVRLRTVAAADEMPDLFVMFPNVMTRDFVRGNLIQPIDDMLSANPEWRDNFIPRAFDDFTVDGKIYTVPMSLAPTSFIYYNQAIFDRYGVPVPETWDQLEEAVRIFNANGIIPIALGNRANWVVQSTIFSTLADRITGTEWFLKAVNQDGAAFTDPEFIEALRLLQQFAELKPFQDGYTSLDENQMALLFFEGKAAMFINGGWATSNIVQNAPREVLDHTHVTILPAIEGGRGNPKSTSGIVGTGLGVNRKLSGARKAAALELFYALSGPEGQKATLDSSTLVSYKIDLDESKAHPLFVELHQLMQTLELSPVYDGYLSAETVGVVNSGLQELLLGADPVSIAAAIQEAQARTARR